MSIPLPPYPGSPASLAAATTFYNAARQEINERVKFRDQVMIAIIAATLGLLGFLNPLDAKAGFATAVGQGANLGSIGEGLFMVVFGTTLVVNFACHYCGYQNAKIAELGYFITAAPAYHLQAYGLHELLAVPLADGEMARRAEVGRIDEAHGQMRRTFSHWDGWSAATTIDKLGTWLAPEHIRAHKEEFSQDKVYRYLLVQFSLLPLAILGITSFRIPADQLIGLPETWDAIWFVASVVAAAWIPFRVRRMLKRAEDLKSYFSDERKKIDARSMFDEP